MESSRGTAPATALRADAASRRDALGNDSHRTRPARSLRHCRSTSCCSKPGELRLGWWPWPQEDARPRRRLARSGLGHRERLPMVAPTARTRLALALLGTSDVDGRATLPEGYSKRRSKLAAPSRLQLLDAIVAARRSTDAEVLAQDLLAGDLVERLRPRCLCARRRSWLNENIDSAHPVRASPALPPGPAVARRTGIHSRVRTSATGGRAGRHGHRHSPCRRRLPICRAAALILQAGLAGRGYTPRRSHIAKLLPSAPSVPTHRSCASRRPLRQPYSADAASASAPAASQSLPPRIRRILVRPMLLVLACRRSEPVSIRRGRCSNR